MPDTVSVLIIDDDQPVRSLLSTILGSKFDCSSAESAGAAITRMETQVFDVVLLDLGLPGMSGLALCRLIVNRCPNTVVIVISGNTDDQSIADAMKAGAIDYLKKPFNLADVVATVDRAISDRRPNRVA